MKSIKAHGWTESGELCSVEINLEHFRAALAAADTAAAGLEERQRCVELLQEALVTDGEHHKTWFIEQALITLGREDIAIRGDHEPGIAP